MTYRATFPDRGVMECFYGPLWSSEDREALVRGLADHDGNLYVYGPAADPHTGGNWRQPYTGRLAQQQEALLAATDSAGVRAAWRVSPSAPMDRSRAMRLADPDEQTLLARRVREQLERGYEIIVLAFDDIDTGIDPVSRTVHGHHQHPLAAAHAEVITSLAEVTAAAGAQLVVCPTHYWGLGPSTYRQVLGSLTPPSVPFWWTGPGICSEAITASQARTVAEQYGHRLWIWDNYPVDDWTASELRRHLLAGSGHDEELSNERSTDQLLTSPLDRRDPSLVDVVDGYAGNAGRSPALSRLLLRTSCMFAQRPATYDPDAAMESALGHEGVPAGAFDRFRRELGTTPVSAATGTLTRIASRLLVCPASEAALAPEETRELTRLSTAVDELDGTLPALETETRAWRNEVRWAIDALRWTAVVLEAWDRRDPTALYHGASAIHGLARADPVDRPVVACGAVDAAVHRGLGLAGPPPPVAPG